ncbi:GntR family transcriptional regulator [Clostridiaceae bacterium 35-E11]
MNKNIELEVYKRLKHSIMTRQLTPSSQLIETAIAESFGVSRTPIRSALKKLEYEGLVQIIPRKGAFVTQTSIEEFIDLFQSRLFLEKEAAKLAATKITSNQLTYFENLMIEELQSYKDRNFEKFIIINNKMHMLIAESSKNKFYIKFINELNMKSNIYLIFHDDFYTKPIDRLNSLKEHKAIFEALKLKNPDKCAEAMELHIKSVFENLRLAKIHL